MIDKGEGLPTRLQFSQQLDRSFRTSGAELEGFELELVEFNDVVDNDVQETFSLVFRGPVNMPPSQTTYTLANDEVGEFDIFLVPVKQDGKGLYFEAVFNRLKDKAL